MSCKIAFVASSAVLLSGCVNEPIAQRDPSLGEAVKFNAAVQTINPDPVYPEDAAKPGDSGEHGSQAVERYRKGDVKEVEQMQTTTGSSGGSTGPR